MDCAVSLMFNLCVEARDGLNLWLLSSISSKQQAEQQFVVTDDAQQLEGGFPSFHGCTSSVFSFYENNLTWSTAVGLVNSGRLAATRTVLMEMIPTFVLVLSFDTALLLSEILGRCKGMVAGGERELPGEEG